MAVEKVFFPSRRSDRTARSRWKKTLAVLLLLFLLKWSWKVLVEMEGKDVGETEEEATPTGQSLKNGMAISACVLFMGF